ncbi:ribokinase [Daejeonella sp.]|uniref:ribokinase n=1 Tax=Daejeonella sp. TaxID=2805397 RepID=UPI0030ECFCF1
MEAKPAIVIVGSSNTDMVIKAEHLPGAGETILGGVFFMNPGGKGANQAVAAARLGGNITFICKTGNDIFGRQSVQLFEDEGIKTSYLLSDPKNPSGVALITVDKDAENCIVVASGANATLSPADIHKAKEAIEGSMIVLMQLEIPLNTVEYVASTAAAKGVKVVLNPAPACELSDELLRNVSVITPNKKEAEMISGMTVNNIDDAKEAAQIIKNKGVETVILTLGPKGALVLDKGEFTHINAVKVEAVDTTAAGDVFNGALVVALAENKSIVEATIFACRAAAISVTRLGAQSSAPFRSETDSLADVEAVIEK